jgi:hypothetical protein
VSIKARFIWNATGLEIVVIEVFVRPGDLVFNEYISFHHSLTVRVVADDVVVDMDVYVVHCDLVKDATSEWHITLTLELNV